MDTTFRVAVARHGYYVSERRLSDGNTRPVTEPEADLANVTFLARQLNRCCPENRDRWLYAQGYPPFAGLGRPRPAAPQIVDILV